MLCDCVLLSFLSDTRECLVISCKSVFLSRKLAWNFWHQQLSASFNPKSPCVVGLQHKSVRIHYEWLHLGANLWGNSSGGVSVHCVLYLTRTTECLRVEFWIKRPDLFCKSHCLPVNRNLRCQWNNTEVRNLWLCAKNANSKVNYCVLTKPNHRRVVANF